MVLFLCVECEVVVVECSWIFKSWGWRFGWDIEERTVWIWVSEVLCTNTHRWIRRSMSRSNSIIRYTSLLRRISYKLQSLLHDSLLSTLMSCMTDSLWLQRITCWVELFVQIEIKLQIFVFIIKLIQIVLQLIISSFEIHSFFPELQYLISISLRLISQIVYLLSAIR